LAGLSRGTNSKQGLFYKSRFGLDWLRNHGGLNTDIQRRIGSLFQA
jgi:hypothetical protein